MPEFPLRLRGLALLILGLVCPGLLAQQALSVRNAAGVVLSVDPDDTDPELRVALPGRPAGEHAIDILFPEHVTVTAHGGAEGVHLYLWRPGRAAAAPDWSRRGSSLEYERVLAPGLRMLARATLEADGVRFRYEFENTSAVAYDHVTAITDPRMGGPLRDPRLERTWVHRPEGLRLLAEETPARLTLPLSEWLPARYLDSFTWPVPQKLVERREDGITYYNSARRVDEPFIATTATEGSWVVASFTRTVGNVWSNPELTCQHVDPNVPLAAGGRVAYEVKVLILAGSVQRALALERRERGTLE